MKGDFSRDSFDPAKHFARVLLQQGRVFMDADFNEQAAIQRELLRAVAKAGSVDPEKVIPAQRPAPIVKSSAGAADREPLAHAPPPPHEIDDERHRQPG